MGVPGRAISLRHASSGSQSEHRIRHTLPTRGACQIINNVITFNLVHTVSASLRRFNTSMLE